MPRVSFSNADFLTAARDLAAAGGPAAVTVGSVTERLGAPSGSFYYRFASRDVLLAELWLATALSFQEGFVAAINAGDGLAAALHTPVWVRSHLDDARLFLTTLRAWLASDGRLDSTATALGISVPGTRKRLLRLEGVLERSVLNGPSARYDLWLALRIHDGKGL